MRMPIHIQPLVNPTPGTVGSFVVSSFKRWRLVGILYTIDNTSGSTVSPMVAFKQGATIIGLLSAPDLPDGAIRALQFGIGLSDTDLITSHGNQHPQSLPDWLFDLNLNIVWGAGTDVNGPVNNAGVTVTNSVLLIEPEP